MYDTSVIAVDTTGVVKERLGVGDGASNRASLVDLLHHVLLTTHKVVLVNTVDTVLIRDEAGLTRVAVAAHVHGRALLTVVMAASLVNRTSFVSDFVLCHPLEGIQMPSTVAAIVRHLTGDEDLGRDVDVGPSGFAGDLDSI